MRTQDSRKRLFSFFKRVGSTILAVHVSVADRYAEFLALLHGTSYAGFSGATPSEFASNPFFAKMNEGGFRRTGPYLVTATPETRFRKLLRAFCENGVHRVYVCEDGSEPVDVVTLTDVLRTTRRAADAAETGPGG